MRDQGSQQLNDGMVCWCKIASEFGGHSNDRGASPLGKATDLVDVHGEMYAAAPGTCEIAHVNKGLPVNSIMFFPGMRIKLPRSLRHS